MRAIKYILALNLALYGCGLPEIKKEAPEENILKKGSKFMINLPEDHRTGYTWQLSHEFDRRVVREINQVWHGNEKGIYFNLLAADTGKTTLRFINRKYTDTASYKTFIVKITDN